MSRFWGLFGLLIGLFEAVYSFKVETRTAWTLNKKDQIAIPLVELFGTNKNFKEIEFVMLSNTTKVTSIDGFFTKEFRPFCLHLNVRDRVSVGGNNSPMTTICNETEFHEISFNATGRISSTKLLANITDMKCRSSGYSPELKVYGLFCLKENEGSAGYYYLHIIDPATAKIVGSSKLDRAIVDSVPFNEKTKVRAVKIPKGGLKGDIAFAIWDEPYSDSGFNIQSKNNHFILMVDVDPASKAPVDKMHVVRFKDDPVLKFPQLFIKTFTYEFIDSKVVMASFLNSNHLKLARCELDTTNAAAVKPKNCAYLEATFSFGYGVFSIMDNGYVGIFNKPELRFELCAFNPNAASTVTNCKGFNGRNDSDVEVEDIDPLNSTYISVNYMNKPKTHSVGVDVFTISANEIKLNDRFKTFVDVARTFQGYFITSQDSFLDVYNDKRTEEMILEAAVLQDEKWHPIQVKMNHSNVTKIKDFSFYRLKRFIYTIALKTAGFPKLAGFLQKVYRIPLGRDFFAGNGIGFELSAPNVKSTVNNAGDAKLRIEDIMFNYVTMYMHSHGYSAVVLPGKQKIFAVNCKKRIEPETMMDCKTIAEANMLDGEVLMGIYETQQLLMLITNKGRMLGYDKLNRRDKTYLLNMEILSATFKMRDTVITVAVLANTTNGTIIKVYEWNQYNVDQFYEFSNITSYAPDPAQETGGKFCPKSVVFEIEDEPNLVVLNSCPEGDRRLIRFSLKNPKTPSQISNRFIRIKEFKQENLQMCTDLETMIVAAPGIASAVGIGYESHNFIQDLGIDEMNMREIKKMVCMGDKAFAIGFYTKKDVFKIATFYVGKMAYADGKLHSIIEFPELKGDYEDFVGSYGDSKIFYNVYGKDKTKSYLKAVYLDGPELYTLSNTRALVNDAEIRTANGYINQNFNMMISFIKQKTSLTVGARKKKTQLAKREYNMEELDSIDGPVFDFDLPKSVPVMTISPRLANMKDYIDSTEAEEQKYLYVSTFAKVGETTDTIFTLIQLAGNSAIHVNSVSSSIKYTVPLRERCNQIEVIELTSDYAAFLSCFQNSEWKFYMYQFQKSNGLLKLRRKSDIVKRSTIMTVAKADDVNRYIVASIDDRSVLEAWTFDAAQDLDGDGKTTFNGILTKTRVSHVRLVRTPKRINVIYFRPSDSKASLVIINPSTRKLERADDYLIVVTTDETTMAAFECAPENGMIVCVFASNGPYIYRIVFTENEAAGLVQTEKSSYMLYDDCYAKKIALNRQYITLVSISASTGKTKLLIYRVADKNGSNFLWSGINYNKYSLRPFNDVNVLVTNDNHLLFTTNHKETNLLSLCKKVSLADSMIQLKEPNLKELAKHKIKFNTLESGIESSHIPLHHFFLHRDEQNDNGILSKTRWYHWVLMIIFFIAVYGGLAYFWRKEKQRRDMLDRDILTYNIDANKESN